MGQRNSKDSLNTKIDLINNVVFTFYKKATIDILIGYQFRKIATSENKLDPLNPPIEAFAHHLPRIELFWQAQLLGIKLPKQTNNFDLISVHHKLLVRRGEINRWIKLFKETLDQQLDASDKLHEQLKAQWLVKLSQFEKIFLEKLL